MSKNRKWDDGQEAKNMAQTLMIGLLYPAVLGTIVYSFLTSLVDSALSGSLSCFIAGGPASVSLKATLFLLTVAFYCCDYVYSAWTENYRSLFFLLDIVVITCLYVTTFAVNISSPAAPRSRLILACYATILTAYLIWDSLELIRGVHKDFYKRMVEWELVSLGGFLLVYASQALGWIGETSLPIVLCGIIAVSEGFFWRLLYLRRKMEAY